MSDWLELAQTTVPLALGIVAYFLGGLNERKRDERTLAREELARKHLRAEARDNERHAFQQATLIELQVSLIALGRSATLTMMADLENIRNTGKFGMLPEDVGGAAELETRGNYHRLVNRVLDDELRAELFSVNDAATAVSYPPTNWKSLSKGEAEALVHTRWARLATELDRVQKALGAALRTELARTDPD